MKIYLKMVAFFQKKLLPLFLLLGSFPALAQDRPEMADTFRSEGKIYVVVLVICTIFAGIILFLLYLERKIKRLEQRKTDTN
jgi:hypothetical protein